MGYVSLPEGSSMDVDPIFAGKQKNVPTQKMCGRHF